MITKFSPYSKRLVFCSASLLTLIFLMLYCHLYRRISLSPEENHNQIDYVELPVRDVAEAKAFYKAVFDWTFEDYGPEYASFFDGRLTGGFRKADDTETDGVLIVFYSNSKTFLLTSKGPQTLYL